VGNSGFTPNAWGGEIDNLAPRVTLIYSPSADYQTAQVSCAAEDFNLVESGWTCPAADATAVYEDATWYTDVFSDVQKLTGLTTSLQTLPVAANPTATACDYFGRCTTVTPAFDILPVPMPPTLVQVDEVMEVATAVFPHYDPAHSYSTTWHWGDGAISPGTIVVSGTAVISGSHSYATGGIYSVYVEVRDDADGSLAAFSVPFTVVVNAPPTLATDNANLTVNEGTTAANSGTVLVELADTPVLTASTGTVIDNGSGSWSWSFDTMDGTDDSQTVTVYADDGRGATDSITFELIVDNVMPTATADHPSITVDEGSVATNNGTFFDPGHDVISMTASIGAVSWDAGNSGNWGWAFTTSDGPAQSQVVTMAIMDSDGAMSELDYTLTVSNVAPMIENISAPSGPVPLHAVPAINVVIAFNDPGGSSDAPYMCTFDFDNDGTVDQIVSSVGEPCNGTPTYDEPGEYTLAVSVTDKDGETTNAIYQYLVIYDPYVALGLEGVYLKQRVTVVSGDVGANTAVASGPYLAGNEEVTIGQHVTFLDANSAVRGDSVMIKQGTEVYDVYANELDNNGTIMGIYSDSVALPLTDFLPEVPVFTPGSQDFDLGQNESLTLAAGSYGQLKAKKGAVITLTGGIYNFSEWDLGQNVTVIIEAPAEIRIMGRLQIGKNGSIGPAANVTDLDASDIFIYVLGVNGNNGNLNTSPKAAQFGLNNSIYANVFVPNGTLYIRQNSEATGSFFGKWVVIGQNVTLTQDSGW
jgi:hypothetical protein